MKKTNGQYDEAKRITKIKDPAHRHVIRCMRSGLVKSKCEMTKGYSGGARSGMVPERGMPPSQLFFSRLFANSKEWCLGLGIAREAVTGGIACSCGRTTPRARLGSPRHGLTIHAS